MNTTSAPHCVWQAGAVLGEGTCWSSREQALYWVDILGRKLHRYRPADASRTSWDFDETISSVAEHATQPGLVVTMRRGYASFDPAKGGAPQYLYRPPEEIPGNRFNDGKCDATGRYWGGTMDYECVAPTGAYYGWSADGRCVRVELGYPVTNGPTWSKDGRTLYSNDTVHGRVHAWDYDPATGAWTNPRVFLQFADGDGVPDGMTTDAAGRLWICHWGGACISAHDAVSGSELGRIQLPTSHITNCTFGGPDLRTLFVTSARFGLTPSQLQDEPLAGGLFTVEMDAPGVPAHRFGAAS